MYFVFTPHGVAMSGFGTQWCAWHSGFYSGGHLASFAYEPYIPDAGGSCGMNFVNGGDNPFGNGFFDGLSVTIGHEMAESETDPDVSSGWQDVQGGSGENGDKCAWNGATSNVTFGAHQFAMQPIWSNADNLGNGGGSCVLQPALAPGAPVIGTATAGAGAATVNWTAPSNGGSSLLQYRITGSPGGTATATGSATSVTVTGLTNGVTYTFTVTAVNGIGPSPASSPSNSVIPIIGGPYTAVQPYRILDTRLTLGGHPGQLGPGETSTLQVTGTSGPGGGVPGGAAAVAVNVTVTNPTAYSFLTIYPGGVGTRPLASNLNFGPGQTIANLVVVALPPDGSIKIYNSQGSDDVIVDVQGWSAGGAVSSPAGLFNSLAAPTRLLDTRSSLGGHPGPLAENAALDLQVAGVAPLPGSGIGAVVLNVTAVNGSQSSYLSVYPTGAAAGAQVSNLNFPPGKNLPNRVIVKLGNGGAVSIYNSRGSVDVVVDASAWITDATAGGTGALLYPRAPVRIVDTRPDQAIGPFATPFGQGVRRDLPVAGHGGLPGGGMVAVIANTTVTNPTSGSFLTLYPSQTAVRPTASDLNFGPGDTVPNLVVVKLGPDGAVTAYNDLGTVDVILDVLAWFA